LEAKLNEAIQAIQDDADDLDFVCNYEAFKRRKLDLVKQEVLECTQLGLKKTRKLLNGLLKLQH
jgi:deoxyribose-phosphate aldolase